MRILYRQHDDAGRLLAPPDFARQRGFEPDGFNMYIGITPDFVQRKTALLPSHAAELELALEWLQISQRPSLLINISLHPLFPVDLAHSERSYELVDQESCSRKIEQLGKELAVYAKKARKLKKSLDIVVRYASEMHDPATDRQPYGRPVDRDGQGLPWQAHAAAFRKSFANVVARLRKGAREIKVSFSPALRADVVGESYQRIREYWPGDEHVKALSATWYVGQLGHFEAAEETLHRFLSDFKRPGVSFGLDEIGGAEVDGGPGSDEVLRPMWEVARDRGDVTYLSFFLLERWGDPRVTLSFLRR